MIEKGFPVLLFYLFFIFAVSLPAEEFSVSLPVNEGEDLPRGTVLSCRLYGDEPGLVFLIRQWNGPFFVLFTDLKGNIRNNAALPEGDYYELIEKGGRVVTLSVPSVLDGTPLREIDVLTGETIAEWPMPEITGLYLKKGGKAEDMEAYYGFSPSGEYLLVEVWIRKGRIRTEDAYFDRQAVLFRRDSAQPLWSIYFNADDCFKGEEKPRFFPCIRAVFSGDEEKIILAGPVLSPAVYTPNNEKNGALSPVFSLRQKEGEYRYLFLPEGDILQYDYYTNRCRLYDGTGGNFKGVMKSGLRYPVISPDGKHLFTIQDDGIGVYLFDESGFPKKTDFLSNDKYLRNSYYLLFPDDGSVLTVPYSYSDGRIRFISYPYPR